MGLKDFDAFFAQEVKKEPKQFKVMGEIFTLPESLPAYVMVQTMRMQSKNGSDAEVSNEDAIMLMDQVFGKSTNQRLLETGIGFDQYKEILQWAVQELSGMGEQNSAEKQAQSVPTTMKDSTY